jgi:excinuclease ABC subunit A
MSADYVLDFGPKAGKDGGTVIAEGTPDELKKDPKSITGKYISNQKKVSRKRVMAEPEEFINISGAKMHNLKNIKASFPLNRLVSITGLSGSGKSTLLHDTLYNNLARELGYAFDGIPGEIEEIEVPSKVKRVSLIDQSPIGRTPRSNPATYTKIFDQIRNIFAETADAKVRGYKLGRFSFNVRGGRCEACRGEGQIKIEMQFLPDVYVTCDVCHGKRYNEETLEVKYRDKNIAEILDMSVDEAYDFFYAHKQLQYKLQTLKEVGLGYIDLGQPAPTLSGGEAQRLKMVELMHAAKNAKPSILIFDEPKNS